MYSNEIEINDVNWSRLAEQGPSSSRCPRQGNIGRHHANPVFSERRKSGLAKRIRPSWSAIY